MSKLKTKIIAPPAKPQRLTLDPDRLIGSGELRAMLGGVSAMTIWRWNHGIEPTFPAPMKIGKRNYWRLAAVQRFLAERERGAAMGQGDD